MWNKIKSAIGFGLAEVTAKMDVDHQDARKRFAWCVLAVSGGNSDPGYRPKFASKALREWYELESHDELLENIDWYIEGSGNSTPAYDAYRGIFLARAGFGAGLLSEAESWEAAFKVLRKLQRTYPSWNEFGSGYLEGQMAYREQQGESEEDLGDHRRTIIESITELNAGLWAKTPFNTPV